MPRLPRAPGHAPRPEQARDRDDDPARPRPRLRDRRARDLPSQALLLSRPAEGLPDLPVRRAALRRRGDHAGDLRRRRRGRASSARTSRRTRRRTCTWAEPRAASPAPTARSSTVNRAGTPLVEIVTAPDLHSAEHAKRFLQLLRQTVVELGISDAEMEKGSLRFDVNVSVRPEGSDELRTRTELKNMNSFNFAAKGIEREISAPDRDLRVGRRGRAGDDALRPRQRIGAAAALEGGGAGLPVPAGARPRAARAAA